ILLESGRLPIESVAEQVGFLSAVTYRQQFKARFGVSPAEWRKTIRVKPYAAKNIAGAME
uniref:AraC family transcriptional regulator n=1 Tax=Serratia marcescens TaxID=615 RepID=UPI0013DD2F4B